MLNTERVMVVIVRKLLGRRGGFWRPEDLDIYEYIVQDCEDKN